MAYVTLEEAKLYLRQDSSFEDIIITSLIVSAEFECRSVARLDKSQWDAIEVADENSDGIYINGDLYTGAELVQVKETLRVAILYSLGYLYEHREEADHKDMTITLRSLLGPLREGVF